MALWPQNRLQLQPRAWAQLPLISRVKLGSMGSIKGLQLSSRASRPGSCSTSQCGQEPLWALAIVATAAPMQGAWDGKMDSQATGGRGRKAWKGGPLPSQGCHVVGVGGFCGWRQGLAQAAAPRRAFLESGLCLDTQAGCTACALQRSFSQT